MKYHKRDAPMLIQSAVNDFVKDITAGNATPAVPFDKLRQAAAILNSFANDNNISWIEHGRELERAIADEFLQRLELKFRAVENNSHVGQALRYAERSIADEFPSLQ
jgi:hypothetical protein